MKVRDIVKYREPLDEGDAYCRFVVTELRGQRVLLTEFAVCHEMSIKPTYVVNQVDLVPA